MKMSFIFIPLAVFGVAAFGSWLTGGGMDWYKTINLPSFTPPGSVIGTVWTIIFILTAISALIFWQKAPRDKRFSWTATFFILNGAFNIFWSYLFFNRHWLGAAVWEAGFLGASVIVLIILIWPVSRLASTLIMPYAAWTTFATYLTYVIWSLNR
ncbi:MAG: TspO/MBR family protein [Patescibacteria group bacterium]|jgi:tryptophan-rich sensory protein